LLNNILKKYCNEVAGKVDCVAMLEARGFLLGTLMALYLNVPCVPVRKKGKLPGKVAQLEYSLEYAKVIIFYLCKEYVFITSLCLNLFQLVN
jgi:adenine phosphoribosyltransferase